MMRLSSESRDESRGTRVICDHAGDCKNELCPHRVPHVPLVDATFGGSRICPYCDVCTTFSPCYEWSSERGYPVTVSCMEVVKNE
jgi:hypothetical protein